MDNTNKKNNTHIANTAVRTIISAAVCAAVVYSHGREGGIYSEINKYSEYVLFHNTDIRAQTELLERAGEKLGETVNGIRRAAGKDSGAFGDNSRYDTEDGSGKYPEENDREYREDNPEKYPEENDGEYREDNPEKDGDRDN
ncbi:MAG: hypothetical protein J1F64_07875 [Oscillospiraceae bacterium]|nr:hypothetical protein [Oscillospiraceae bacterium]